MDGKKKVSFKESAPPVSSEDLPLVEVKNGGAQAQSVNKERHRKLSRAASRVAMEITVPGEEEENQLQLSPDGVVSISYIYIAVSLFTYPLYRYGKWRTGSVV